MAKKKKETNVEQSFGNIEESLSKTEQFIEKNQKILSYSVLGILLLITAFYAYNKYVVKPKEIRAQSSIFVAQKYFAKDSFNLALHGDGNYDGFLTIIEDFGSTKAGNMAKFYAGICYREMDEFDNSISYLEDFDADDFHFSSLKFSTIGDCYLELGDTEKAAESYLKASKINPNNYSTPVYLTRAGFIFEQMEEYEKALELFKKVEKEYPNSIEARDIQKFITRVKMRMR